MTKTTLFEFGAFSFLLQSVIILLKLTGITRAGWLIILWPTWSLVLIVAVVIAVFVVLRNQAMQKPKTTYTSRRWQEKLSELNYSRLN